jgi:small subunit ribosomal protein S16
MAKVDVKSSLATDMAACHFPRSFVRERQKIPSTIMAVSIRLKRIGARNTPAFRIVVTDSRSPRDGKCIEELGSYDPKKKGDNFTLNLERAKHWVSVGAQPSDTVASFIRKAIRTAPAAA